MYIIVLNLVINNLKKFIVPILSICFLIVISFAAYAGYQWYTLSNENKVLEDEIAQLNAITEEETDVETRTVSLFYYNLEADKDISESIPCSDNAVLPVEREIPLTQTPIRDTLDLLLEGILTDEEIADGFQTEFPNESFKISSINLDEGVLYIEFTDAPDFVSGGSCRTGLLDTQIRKTALQFSEVDSVEYLDKGLFQP